MQLRLYDAAGRRVAAVGRRGSGPGEFQAMGPMSWKADTLVVFDVRQRRLTYITPSGALRRVTGLPAAVNQDPFSTAAAADTSFMFFTPTTVLPDGSMMGTAHVRLRGADGERVPRVMVHYSDGRGPRVVGHPPDMLDDRWQMTIGGLSNPVPFAFQPAVNIANDGRHAFLSSVITSSRGGEYTLSYFEPDGDQHFARTIPFEGERIPQRAIDSAIAAFNRPNGELPGAGPRFAALARDRVRPVRHAVEGVLVGHDNTVWVDLRPDGATRTTLVFNARGDIVATVQLPVRTRIQAASATQLWALEFDDDGLASVVRYQVQGVGCGAVRC
jgi:hypothetical protein